VVDWFLEQQRLDPAVDLSPRAFPGEASADEAQVWRATVMCIAEDSRRVSRPFQRVDRPHRAVHALHTLLDRFPDDSEVQERLAQLHLTYFEVGTGTALLNQIASRDLPHAFSILDAAAFAAFVASRCTAVTRSVELLEIDINADGQFAEGVHDYPARSLNEMLLWASDVRVARFLARAWDYMEDGAHMQE
jgi:hypothetical protein